ncbi:MAG: hypothetical protein CW716_04330, partial [Candidatus Bathyarchaeum sp.]
MEIGMMRKARILSPCVLLFGLLLAVPSTAIEYEIVDLGTLGGESSYALSINNSGQVVGQSWLASGQYHAFLWAEDMGMRDLGTLGGSDSVAYAINDTGQIVGWSRTASGTHAFLWSESDGMRDLGTLGGWDSGANSINNMGQIVGTSRVTSGQYHAFLWSEAGGMQDLVGGIASSARAINDSGQVVCSSSPILLWTANGGIQYTEVFGVPFGINESGHVVGYTNAGAFLWTEAGGIQNLGTLGGNRSEAAEINDSEQVVGWAHTPSGLTHAFLWTADGGMQDLGTLGGGYSRAEGINETGRIVGRSHTSSNVWHACMWIPETPCTPVTIESLTGYPLVVPLGDAVDLEAIIVDGCGEIDALWDFDDGTVESQSNITSPVTATKNYTAAGVYTVLLTLSDEKVDVGENIDVVVYDPTGGFATGAGLIYSPAGAYKPDLSLSGKARFAFISKYNKGATIPTGNVTFIFKMGDLYFHSSSYD